MTDTNHFLEQIKWDEKGLIPAIVQQANTGEVLMMAWMNAESLALSLEKRQAVYWSRSRARLWLKGETSGNVQNIVSIRLDCDSDCLLLLIEQVGGVACHSGRESCFYQEHSAEGWQTISNPKVDPKQLYPKKIKNRAY